MWSFPLNTNGLLLNYTSRAQRLKEEPNEGNECADNQFSTS